MRMAMIKKKNLIVAIILVLMISLCGCNSRYNETEEEKNLRETLEYIQAFPEYNDLARERYLELINDYSYINRKDAVLLVNNNIDKISVDCFNDVANFIKDKYYIKANLKKYLDYYKKNDCLDIRRVVEIINSHAEQEIYTNTQKTDISMGMLMLCNKYNGLDSDYKPNNLIKVEEKYKKWIESYLEQEAYDNFVEMAEDAIKEGNTIYVHSNNGYRNYDDQKKAFDYYVKWYGYETALNYAAKPGFSEHQTGLAVDILFNYKDSESYSYENFHWLLDNSWKYGYIVRYPLDKENVTRNDYEPWHYRYVGKEVAKYIYENNITFDEYYNYFLVDNSISEEDYFKMFE